MLSDSSLRVFRCAMILAPRIVLDPMEDEIEVQACSALLELHI